MELLSPAGNTEKLDVVYRYGADAAYIGLGDFSLRQRADNVDPADPTELAAELARIKGTKRLYGTLNIYFQQRDLASLEEQVDKIAALPLDALIISDIGVLPLIRRAMPNMELHLSTQANCTNSEAARLYHDMGFARIVPARELSLAEIESIKRAVPEVELELFVHGAMCLAYSGRCLLSAWMAGRSGNRGDCAHSCRWDYRIGIEEKLRPGEYLPVEEGAGFTSIMSPKDLNMIDHLAQLRDAGADALKIEGRVKSAYYGAIVTRAYRKELDRLESGSDSASTRLFVDELQNVSHREFSTGFFFGNPDAVAPSDSQYKQRYRFMGSVGKSVSANRYEIDVKNGFDTGREIEFIGPDLPSISDDSFTLYDRLGEQTDKVTHHAGGFIQPGVPVEPGYLIRRRK
jgi:U32 family peptidase